MNRNSNLLLLITVILGLFLGACSNFKKISYQCPEKTSAPLLLDTINIHDPVIVTVFEKKKVNRVIIPYEEFKKVGDHFSLSKLLKHGAFLTTTNVQSYLSKKQTASLNLVLLGEPAKDVGKNSITRFTQIYKRFLIFNVNVGCYNKYERTIGYNPIRSNGFVKVIYPLD